MTNEEFTTFAKRLFICFPSLSEWLKQSSPDPAATQAVWRKCLEPYRLDECLFVLERWSTGTLGSPEAYERDKVHLHVRSVIEGDRAKQRRKSDSRELVSVRNNKTPALSVPGVAAAYLAGYELKKEVMAGKLDEQECKRRMRELVESIQ